MAELALPDPALLANVSASAHAIVRRPSPCVPAGAMMLTYAEDGGLRALAFQRVASLRCLMARLLSVLTFADAIPGSQLVVHTFWTSPPKPSSRYHAATWLKWHLLAAALRGCAQVLHLDADVLVLRNPFDHLPRTDQVAVAYQSERICTADRRDCPVNGGLLVARSLSLVHSVLSRQSMRGFQLDQQAATLPIFRSRHIHLPDAFVGHCWFWKGFGPLPDPAERQRLLCGAATYHACGLSPKLKMPTLKAVLNQTTAAACSKYRRRRRRLMAHHPPIPGQYQVHVGRRGAQAR